MKKFIALFLAIISITVVIFSCGNAEKPVETKVTSNSETVMTTTTAETHATIAHVETTTEAINIETSFEIIGKYENISEERPFEEFWVLDGQIYREKASFEKRYIKILNYSRFVVLGIEEKPEYANTMVSSYYYIKILAVSGNDLSQHKELIGQKFKFLYRGTPENPIYDRNQLEIGKEYIAIGSLNSYFDGRGIIGPCIVFGIEEDNAEEYLYGYGLDLSELPFAIKITDEYENQVYKKGIHDKQIEQLKKKGIPLPTYDYKCKLTDIFK